MQYLSQALEEIKVMEKRIEQLRSDIHQKEEQIQELKKRSKRSVKFDEATIAEHDKERGTRMKIDEPKTPYVREEPFSFADADPEGIEDDIPVLNDALVFDPSVKIEVPPVPEIAADNTVAPLEGSVATARLGRPQMLDLNLVQSALESDKAKRDFEAARSQHYNEYAKLKAWREKQQRKDEDEDEDEDEGEDDEGEKVSEPEEASTHE